MGGPGPTRLWSLRVAVAAHHSDGAVASAVIATQLSPTRPPNSLGACAAGAGIACSSSRQGDCKLSAPGRVSTLGHDVRSGLDFLRGTPYYQKHGWCSLC